MSADAAASAKRSKLKKILVVAGAVLALVVAVLLAAPLFIDADTFRPAIEKLVQDKLGRDVKLGELGVSFLPPSVTVADVEVAGSAGGEPWFKAKGVRVRAAWSGLLAGRLAVQGVAIDGPEIRLLRSPDGRWNLVEMLGGGKSAPAGGGARIDSLRIRNGHVEVVDAFIVKGKVTRLDLSDLQADVSGLGSSSGLDVEASGTFGGGGKASWKGRVGPGSDFDGRARLDALVLAPLAPYLPNASGPQVIDGAMTCDLEVERNADGATAKGRASVTDFRLPTAARGTPPVSAEADIDVTAAPTRIDVRRFDVRSGTTSLKVAGGITDEPGEQVVSIEVDAPKAVLADIVRLAAAAGQALPLSGIDGGVVALSGKARIVRQGNPRVVTSVALDGVRVRGPKLTLRRETDGDWHLVGAAPAPKARGASPSVRVRDLEVTDASIRLEDAARGAGAATEIRDARLSLESWTPGEIGKLSMSAGVAGGKVSLQGRVAAPVEGGRGEPWDATVEITGLDLAQAGALAAGAGLAPKAGRLDWSARLGGVPGKDLAATGKMNLHGVRLPLPSGREVTLDMPIEHDLRFAGDGRVKLERLSLGVPGGPLDLDGRFQTGDVLRYDVGTRGTARVSPEALTWLVALAGTALPFELELSEPLELDARARNGGGGLELSGRADVRRARVRHPLLDEPLDVARATVTLAGDSIDVRDAALKLGGSALAGSLSVQDFENPRLEFDLTSDQADLDELFAMTGRARAGAPAAAPGGGQAPLSQRMRASGRLRVERATFGGLEFSRFDTTVNLRDGRMAFDPSALALYGGRGTGRAVFDLTGAKAAFDVDMTLDDVDAQALLAAGIGYTDLAGRGTLVARLQGQAGTLDETLRGVRGQGTMRLVDGELKKLNALEALEKAAVFGEKSIAALGSRLARDGTPFSSLDGTWTLEGGTMRIAKGHLVAPDGDIDASGTVSLLNQRLDLDALIVFSRALSEQMRAEGSRAAQVFWDTKRSQVLLPARLTGTVAQPQADIDWDEAMSRVLSRQGNEALGQILGGGRQEPAGGSGSTAPSSGGGSVGDILGGILGGKRPGASAPAPAGTSAPAREPQAQSSQAGDGRPVARIDQARMGGSFLTPDLKLRVTLSGTDLSHGIVVVESADGREVAKVERAFADQVTAFYATAPRDQPADIPVRLTVDAGQLGGTGPFVVFVQPVAAGGQRGSEAKADVAKASSPF